MVHETKAADGLKAGESHARQREFSAGNERRLSSANDAPGFAAISAREDRALRRYFGHVVFPAGLIARGRTDAARTFSPNWDDGTDNVECHSDYGAQRTS